MKENNLFAMVGTIDVGRVDDLNMIVTLNPAAPLVLVPSLKPVVRGQTELDVDRALSDASVQRRAVAQAKKMVLDVIESATSGGGGGSGRNVDDRKDDTSSSCRE